MPKIACSEVNNGKSTKNAVTVLPSQSLGVLRNASLGNAIVVRKLASESALYTDSMAQPTAHPGDRV